MSKKAYGINIIVISVILLLVSSFFDSFINPPTLLFWIVLVQGVLLSIKEIDYKYGLMIFLTQFILTLILTKSISSVYDIFIYIILYSFGYFGSDIIISLINDYSEE